MSHSSLVKNVLLQEVMTNCMPAYVVDNYIKHFSSRALKKSPTSITGQARLYKAYYNHIPMFKLWKY